ncbi:MAG: hypothetical protein FRX49_01829 [Trebouxia sp. A1-2]|nr:MAG: hypothetical protein FRX49_01829 [Trebouxia sp. A1-2]
MAFRPLSVIAAVRQPGDTEDVAEERAQVANANYIAARRWDAVVESRNVCEQVSTAHAELQSELQRSTRKLRAVEKELEALNKEHKDFVRAYASVEGSSCNIEAYLRQEIEAADMLRSNMQQVYKEQLHEQQGLVAELVKENQSLMEDKASLTKEVTWLRRQLEVAQTTQATPTGPEYMARSSLGLGTGGSPLTLAESPTSGVASLSDAGSPMSSSSVASHNSEAFSCLIEDLAIGTGELSRGASIVQTTQATPTGPANMASPPFGSSPSFQQRALLTTPHPIPVYQSGQVAVDRVPGPGAGGWHVRVHDSNPRRVTFKRRAACSNHRVLDPETGTPDVQLQASNPGKETLTSLLAASRAHKQGLQSSPCPDNPLKVTIRAAQHLNSPSPLVLPSSVATLCFLSGDAPSCLAVKVEALSAMDTSPPEPQRYPLVNSYDGNYSIAQARSLSIGGTPPTPSAKSPTFGVASLSAPHSSTISSSVASLNSDVFNCLMEDMTHMTKELSREPNPGVSPLRAANLVVEPKAGGWDVRVHDSNPRRVTFLQRAESSDPSFTLPSPSSSPHSFIPLTAVPLLVPSALAADTVGGSSTPLSLSRPSSASGAGHLLAASYASAPCFDNPLEVTVRGAPVISQVPSSPLDTESSPAELDADAAADTSSSTSPLASPVRSIHSALLNELPSPMAIVEALCAMGTPAESPKATPLVNLSQRPALGNLTNRFTPQARVTSGLAASAQTSGKANPPTSAAGRHLSAFLQRKSSMGSPSSCPRPQTSTPRVVVTGSRSATSTRSNSGCEASPGTPPALDLLSPARALGNRPRAVGRFSMALPSDAAARAVSTQNLSPTVPFQTLVSPTAPSPPRPVSSNPRGSLLGARAFGYTPTASFAEPPVSTHSLGSLVDQRFSPNLALPEAQGPIPSPAMPSAVTISPAAVPLQLTPMQQPPQEAHGPSAHSVAASNSRTRTVPSSAVSSGKASRRSSTSNSIADRPVWSASFSRCTAVHARLAQDMTPVSRRLTTASPHRTASSPKPSPSPVRAPADSPAVEPSSVQAIRRTGSKAAAARLMSTARTGGSARTAAQPGGVRPTAAQSTIGRAAVQGTSRAARAAPTRAGPAAPAPAAHRPATIRVTTRSSKAAASTPAGQSVAKHSKAASGRLGGVQSESGPAPVEPKQTRKGQDRTGQKEGPSRTQPARRAKDSGHTWKF